jgi:hypothetical protein
MAEDDTRCWRIPMKVEYEHEHTREAWERDEIGIWYGCVDRARLAGRDPAIL